MTNALCILFYSPFFFITLILLFATLKKDRSSFFVKYCQYFYLSILAWQICELLYFIAPSAQVVQYVFDLKLVFVALLAASMFLMVAGFYRLDRIFPKWLTQVIYILPWITALLAIFSPFHPLLREGFTVFSLEPLTITSSTRGLWFYIHMVYCQALAFSLAGIILIFYRKLPRAYTKGTFFLFLSLSLYFLCTFFESSGLNKYPIDFNLIGSSFAGILFFLAIIVNDRLDYTHIEHQEVFHYLDEGVFILNNQGQIVDANRPAQKIVQLLGETLGSTTFDELLANQIQQGKIRLQHPVSGEGEDMYILGTEYPLIYNLCRQPIKQPDQRTEGSYVIFKDVTNNRLLMERLQDMAGVDALTNLPNRYRFIQLLRELDKVENLPLSIIVGDINGLKTINDSFGHQQGDQLLTMVAKVLRVCCPEDGYVARIGGDEFVLLLPTYSAEKAEQVMQGIKAQLQQIPKEWMRQAIALGSATKEAAEENMNMLIREADFRMFRDKNAWSQNEDVDFGNATQGGISFE